MDQGVGVAFPPGEIWVGKAIHRPDQDLEEGVKAGQKEAMKGDNGLLSTNASA